MMIFTLRQFVRTTRNMEERMKGSLAIRRASELKPKQIRNKKTDDAKRLKPRAGRIDRILGVRKVEDLVGLMSTI